MRKIDFIPVAAMDVETNEGWGSMTWARIALSRHLMSTVPKDYDYIQECATQNAKLKEISDRVEIGLCTCLWLNS